MMQTNGYCHTHNQSYIGQCPLCFPATITTASASTPISHTQGGDDARREAERRLDLPEGHEYGKDSPAAKYVKVFTEGAEWAKYLSRPSQREQVGGMRWVRAAVRVPEKFSKPVIVRVIGSDNKIYRGTNMGHVNGWDTGEYWFWDDTEWLEEIPRQERGEKALVGEGVDKKYCGCSNGDECDMRCLPEKWVAERVLRVRDALVRDDPKEAYHWLYAIASPEFDKFYPWADMEAVAGWPESKNEWPIPDLQKELSSLRSQLSEMTAEKAAIKTAFEEQYIELQKLKNK